MLLRGHVGTHRHSHHGRHGRELELTAANPLGVTLVPALSRLYTAL